MAELATPYLVPQDALSPTVFKVNTVKRRPKLRISFSFGQDAMLLSVDLYKRLNFERFDRLAFIEHKGAMYVTRCDDKDAFSVIVSRDLKFGVVSAVVYNKPFSEYIRHRWGNAPADFVRVPVLDLAIEAQSVDLDPKTYPHPLYRLVIDQKQLRDSKKA